MSSRRITIFDTTLRDGEQAPGIALQPDEKVEIAKQLERLGVDVIEAGFAASSPGDFEGVRDVAQAFEARTVASLCRTRRRGHRRRGGGARGRAALADAHLPRHQPAPHGEEASPRRPTRSWSRRRRRSRVRARAPTRSSSRARTRRARTRVRRPRLPRGDRGRGDDDQPARHRRLRAAARVRGVHRRPPSSARSSRA